MKTNTNTEKKVRMTFTARELETIYYALNDHFLDQAEKSSTYGMGLGWEDEFHKEALFAGDIQIRVWDKMTK